MKAFLGVVAFVVFVGGLMALAYVTSQPKGAPRAQLQRRPMPVVANDDEQQQQAQPQQADQQAQNEDNKPVPLPELFVYRDDKDPKPIALAGPRKKPILLHLWASWCGPCRAELPSLMQFAKKGQADLVAVSVDDHFEDVVKFFHGHIPPEVVWDKKITLERALGVENIPTTFVVDGNGMVRDRYDGAQPWENPELAKAIADDLK